MINQITITNDNINLNVITYDLNNPSAILIHLHGLGNHFQPISDTFFSLFDQIQSIEN